MIRVYLRQAWMLMKQHRLFTGIYVVGTGLSIALVMTMFIVFYVKFAPIYPEYNRDRTLVVKAVKRFSKGQPDNWNINGGMAYYGIKELLPAVPHVEAVAGGVPGLLEEGKVTLPNQEQQPVLPYYADAGFWKVFTFRFLCGKPFTQADVDSSMPVAVLSQSLAQRLFATTDAEGRHFTFNDKEFRVCGVVQDVSNATPETAADLWIPLFHEPWIEAELGQMGLLGSVYAYILVNEAGHMEAVRAAVQERIRQYSLQDKEYEYDLMGQPDSYMASTFRQDLHAPNMGEIVRSLCYILFALLFIPALNLSGMISSRMGQRLCELGVRKAYGATRGQLLRQVLCENLLLTLVGGLMGLLLSYLILITTSDWILTLFDERGGDPTKNVSLTAEMLFNPVVFLASFAMCVLLNVISALLPAASALRHPIVHSLNTNR